MPRVAALAFVVLAFAAGCTGGGPNEDGGTIDVQLPQLDSADLRRAALQASDPGDGWTAGRDVPSTVQVGGRVGPANITSPTAQATSVFEQDDGPGIVSDSIFLMPSVEIAAAVMDAHREAAGTKTWDQKREEGGTSSFTNTGQITGLADIGDDVATAKLDVEVTDAEGKKVQRKVQYVAYRKGAIVAFIVGQDTEIADLARKQASRLDDVIAKAPAGSPGS